MTKRKNECILIRVKITSSDIGIERNICTKVHKKFKPILLMRHMEIK